ncbi:MAG: Uncharacterized protein AUREO_007710 [Aureobasidium pullulans]|uniref:Uncharacterized protein n=1 Tax=Aureobasidium pullulans TaxID=5580 RepID=A0A1A7MS47_AURPU|nr:MAG: Uncharacterized protein AUREO_007710 [Aureobasidium pullulans]THV79107.1 hypothetical protein D6D29_07156 [Aureobasidium pullulans]THW82819.1 hypothetical protein D6D15_09986 [Aureobasidium pullulans]THW99468.1 hypothetical protein D6D18_04773 [Aureobasidium pullulans]THY45497.1 hypothetical protein D6C98_07807 [Aureobasidium pullulans]
MASLTDTQTRYLALAWLCFDAEPKIDYERFAQLAGLKSAQSGREMLRVTKKKLQEFAPVSADGTVAPPNTPATKTKKKATPKTKSTAKAKGGKKRKITNDSDEESDAGDDTPIKKKAVVKKEPIDEDSDTGAGAGAEVDSGDAEV